MKVSRAQAEKNRDRVIDVAAALFRERGFDGIGLTSLMKAAGLTHGGFYGQFKSKEDLAAQASGRALAENLQKWSSIIDGAAGDPLRELVAFYLSENHRDAPGQGCALAALGPDAARHGGALRSTFTEGVGVYLEILSKMMAGRSAAEKRRKAMATLAEMVGAIVLARAVDDADLSKGILEATARDLMADRGR
jgi:TetR/AcrR family transcriptional repressor of nem operon